MSDAQKVDPVSGIETTGHSWDGIEELNNPLPRWWLWTFYATILFAIGYTILYPAWPGIHGATKGLFGWSSRADLRSEMTAADAANAALVEKIKSSDIKTILGDDNLRTFAVAAGGSIFKVRCVTCHGSGAQGGPGYPNLNDNSWLWGGTPEDILQTITHGVRFASDADTRSPPPMPAFGKDGMLDQTKIVQVANFVRKISGQTFDEAQATPGAEVFAQNCASCHGDKGEGKAEFGAPQLNDAIWLYGGTLADIEHQVNNPRLGVMPAWGPQLGDVAVKELAAYVHSLGGGQ
ncbi:cytochrome-c oxidase, cbb3-type subunit III [Aestuariivirga sp.]|uniref:cytochrome-c oxidase, cbb3-type subunit III n=1 Tax=Aestuariivirga sp. TaxID=2650926 RepID=UPI0039E42A47